MLSTCLLISCPLIVDILLLWIHTYNCYNYVYTYFESILNHGEPGDSSIPPSHGDYTHVPPSNVQQYVYLIGSYLHVVSEAVSYVINFNKSFLGEHAPNPLIQACYCWLNYYS